MIKQVESYVIDQKGIHVDDFVEFKAKDGECFHRGIVTYVDKDSIKIVRRYHDQVKISAHSMGTGLWEVKKVTVVDASGKSGLSGEIANSKRR